IPVLLVEEKFARIFRRLMADVHQAARLFARVFVKDTNVLPALFFCAGFYQHVDLKNYHFNFTLLSEMGFAGALRTSAANCGSIMVWSRSGPVETMPIKAPLSRSINRRYSCAFFGRASKPAAPSVDFFQPGILV